MASKNKKDFINSIKVNTTSMKPSIDLRTLSTPEYSVWINELLESKHEQLLYRTEDHIRYLWNKCRANFPHITIHGHFRLKSENSRNQNLNRGKNLLDAIGITLSVSSVSLEKSPEDILASAMESLGEFSKDSEVSYIKSELEKILLSKISAGKDNIKYDENDYFSINLFGREQNFKNIEVLFVNGINQAIAKIKKFKSSNAEGKKEIISSLQNAKSATSYGASLDIYNYFIGELINDPRYTLFKKRCKPFLKNNGYASQNLGIQDLLTGIPIELKIMDDNNLLIAEEGSAKHEYLFSKGRSLDSIGVKNSTKKQISELISFFNDEYFEEILSKVPDYGTIDYKGRTHVNTPVENFMSFYKRSLDQLSPKVKELYFIGLQLHPTLLDQFGPEYSYHNPDIDTEKHRMLSIIYRMSALEQSK